MNPDQDDEPLGEIADDGERRVSNALPLQAREYSRALRGTRNVMRRFNRNTMWVAMGLLSTVIFAALVLAVQERRAKAADPPVEAVQAGRNVLLSTNVSTLTKDVGLTAKSPTGEISSGQATSVDNGFTPKINRTDLQAIVSSWSPAHSTPILHKIQPLNPSQSYSGARPSSNRGRSERDLDLSIGFGPTRREISDARFSASAWAIN
jgi:hypothetical protein